MPIHAHTPVKDFRSAAIDPEPNARLYPRLWQRWHERQLAASAHPRTNWPIPQTPPAAARLLFTARQVQQQRRKMELDRSHNTIALRIGLEVCAMRIMASTDAGLHALSTTAIRVREHPTYADLSMLLATGFIGEKDFAPIDMLFQYPQGDNAMMDAAVHAASNIAAPMADRYTRHIMGLVRTWPQLDTQNLEATASALAGVLCDNQGLITQLFWQIGTATQLMTAPGR